MAIVGAIAGSIAGVPVGVSTDWQQPNAAGGLSYGVALAGLSYDSVLKATGMAANQLFGIVGAHPAQDQMYVWDLGTEIQEWGFTAGDISTAAKTDVHAVSGNNTGIDISQDGTKIFYVLNAGDTLFSITMTTPLDLTTAGAPATGDSGRDVTGGALNTSVGVNVSADGGLIFVFNQTTYQLCSAELSTPYDPSTVVIASRKTYATGHATGIGRDCTITPDGKYAVTCTDAEEVRVHQMVTPWDLDTAVFVAAHDVGTLSGGLIDQLAGAYIDVYNKKFYAANRTNNTIYQFSWTG